MQSLQYGQAKPTQFFASRIELYFAHTQKLYKIIS